MRLSTDRETGDMARGRRACGCALAGVCCALVGACAPLSTPPGGGDALLAAFVVLAEEGRPVARAITSGAACPVLVADGSLLPMTTRAPAATLPLRPTRSAPEDSKPSAFPVRVCEATLPAGTKLPSPSFNTASAASTSVFTPNRTTLPLFLATTVCF